MDLSESMELTGQQRGLVFDVGKAYGKQRFVGQGNASVLFKALGIAPARWTIGYALNIRLEKFSHLDACHWPILPTCR